MARGAQGACPAELRSEPGALVPTQQPPASEQGSRNRELSSPPRKRLPFQPLLEATCSLGKEKGWVLGSQPTPGGSPTCSQAAEGDMVGRFHHSS